MSWVEPGCSLVLLVTAGGCSPAAGFIPMFSSESNSFSSLVTGGIGALLHYQYLIQLLKPNAKSVKHVQWTTFKTSRRQQVQ